MAMYKFSYWDSGKMDRRRAIDERRRIGTVKAAVSTYGERFLEAASSSLDKFEKDLPEKVPSRVKELHMAKKETGGYNESRRASDVVKAQAESELSNAKKTVKELALQLEESNSKAKARMRDVEMVKKSRKHRDNKGLGVGDAVGHYEKVMRELERVKQELRKLKLDMASVLEEKTQALKEIECCSSKSWSDMSSMDTLEKEIEEINEEQVLVELAKIEAKKELLEIEALREKEASEFASKMEETKKIIDDVKEEIDQSKELEAKLAVTLYDVNVLQNELKLANETEKKGKINEISRTFEGSFGRAKDPEVLRSTLEELEAAKKELASTREESFQFMTSMDIIRGELKHVREETARLTKTKERADVTVQNLNSKLLRAKSKLEAATAVEEKAKSLLSNLSLTLQQLKTEVEVTKKEKELIGEETAKIKAEIQKTESQVDLTEERMQAAIQELEAVRLKEAFAVENLKKAIESAVTSRAAAATKQNSSITISKFEYEYLTGHAAAAEAVADKKVAAAQAWIDALKASEKEMLMKIELAHREVRQTRVEEEQEVHRAESSLTAKTTVEGEMRKWRKRSGKREDHEQQPAFQRRSTRGNGNLTPLRRGKLRRFGSPSVRITPRITPPSTNGTGRKKRQAVPNIIRLFTGKKK